VARTGRRGARARWGWVGGCGEVMVRREGEEDVVQEEAEGGERNRKGQRGVGAKRVVAAERPGRGRGGVKIEDGKSTNEGLEKC